MALKVEVSVGELLDKITILEIKSERIKDAAKLVNVNKELDTLRRTWQESPLSAQDVANQIAQLKVVNEALWDIEDNIRRKEADQAFDDEFIQLARSVYHQNDIRAAVKKEINTMLGSGLVEEKSYVDYRPREVTSLPAGVDLAALVALRRQIHAAPELSGREEDTPQTWWPISLRPPARRPSGGTSAVMGWPWSTKVPSPVPPPCCGPSWMPCPSRKTPPGNGNPPAPECLTSADTTGTWPSSPVWVNPWRPFHRSEARWSCFFIPPRKPVKEPPRWPRTPGWSTLLPTGSLPCTICPVTRPDRSWCAGALCAGSAGLTINLIGRTSHAAYPEQGKSPDQALAEIVVGLSTLPIPLEADDRLALVTVGHARLGEPAFGITPGKAEILATIRSDNNLVLTELKERAVALAEQIASKHGLFVTTSWSEEFPVTWNHPEAAEAIEQAATKLGLNWVHPDESPFRWSEDFGHLLTQGKGAMFGLGSGEKQPPLHAGDYDFNDDIIELGVALLDRLRRAVAESPHPG